MPLQQTSKRLTTPLRPSGTSTSQLKYFKPIKYAKIFALYANFGYDLPHLIIYALNNITNTIFYAMNSICFYCQHSTHNIIGPRLKMLGKCLERMIISETLFEKCNICQYCTWVTKISYLDNLDIISSMLDSLG